MSKDEDSIFPPAWEWDKYELAFREMMNRMAQAWEEPTPYGRLLDIGHRVVPSDYETLKFEAWKHQQEQEGRLPPHELVAQAGGPLLQIYDDIFDSHLTAARVSNRARRVFHADEDHGKRYNPPTGKLAPANGNCDPSHERPRGRPRR